MEDLGEIILESEILAYPKPTKMVAVVLTEKELHIVQCAVDSLIQRNATIKDESLAERMAELMQVKFCVENSVFEMNKV